MTQGRVPHPKHPLYETLRNVVLKHLGIEDIVEAVLEKMGNVNEIILVATMQKERIQVILRFF